MIENSSVIGNILSNAEKISMIFPKTRNNNMVKLL
jgi:hypothetical protein